MAVLFQFLFDKEEAGDVVDTAMSAIFAFTLIVLAIAIAFGSLWFGFAAIYHLTHLAMETLK